MSASRSWVRSRSDGLALVAVLWMVAALSLLAAGLSSLTKGEVRGAQNVRSAVTAVALGDAAIQLVALELRAPAETPRGTYVRQLDFGEHLVTVRVVPVAGLIDLNAASESLLRDLFLHAAGRSEAAAEQIANNIVEWRSDSLEDSTEEYEAAGMASGPRGSRFEFPEDLLQVLGVGYDDYASIANFVSVVGGNPTVDPMSAPLGVLRILARGDNAVASEIARARDVLDPAIDTTGLVQEYLGGNAGPLLRIDALIRFDDRSYRRTRWINVHQRTADGAPWRTLRIESAVGSQSVLDEFNGI